MRDLGEVISFIVSGWGTPDDRGRSMPSPSTVRSPASQRPLGPAKILYQPARAGCAVTHPALACAHAVILWQAMPLSTIKWQRHDRVIRTVHHKRIECKVIARCAGATRIHLARQVGIRHECHHMLACKQHRLANDHIWNLVCRHGHPVRAIHRHMPGVNGKSNHAAASW